MITDHDQFSIYPISWNGSALYFVKISRSFFTIFKDSAAVLRYAKLCGRNNIQLDISYVVGKNQNRKSLLPQEKIGLIVILMT